MSGVVILDDSEDLQSLLSLVLKHKFGLRSLCFSRLSQMQDQASEVLKQKVAILDINLGPGEPSGLDAYYWLKQQNFNGKVAMLTGHAISNPLVVEALKNGVEVYEKPLRAELLLKIIEKLKVES